MLRLSEKYTKEDREETSNITDRESAKIKGAHGYIQGYNGIAAAEAFGSEGESEYFPEMLDSLSETMKGLSGEEEPLKKAIIAGDTGYVTEKHLKAAAERGIQVLIPDQQFRVPGGLGTGRFTAEDFEYDEQGNRYRCPAGKDLLYKGHVKLNRNGGEKYQARSV
ncbi:MAG: IS1182 family transposase, partial [Treponema sp.]|nr:IS1182 family transposase [Treponema sp.]